MKRKTKYCKIGTHNTYFEKKDTLFKKGDLNMLKKSIPLQLNSKTKASSQNLSSSENSICKDKKTLIQRMDTFNKVNIFNRINQEKSVHKTSARDTESENSARMADLVRSDLNIPEHLKSLLIYFIRLSFINLRNRRGFFCKVGHKHISTKLKCSERSSSRRVCQLEELGLLKILRRRGTRYNIYVVSRERLTNVVPESGQKLFGNHCIPSAELRISRVPKNIKLKQEKIKQIEQNVQMSLFEKAPEWMNLETFEKKHNVSNECMISSILAYCKSKNVRDIESYIEAIRKNEGFNVDNPNNLMDFLLRNKIKRYPFRFMEHKKIQNDDTPRQIELETRRRINADRKQMELLRLQDEQRKKTWHSLNKIQIENTKQFEKWCLAIDDENKWLPKPSKILFNTGNATDILTASVVVLLKRTMKKEKYESEREKT